MSAGVVPAPPSTRRLVERFTGAERVLHWGFAVAFILLLLSGLGLYLPPGSNPVLAHRDLVRAVHLDSAIAMIAVPVLVAAARPGTLRRFWHDVEWFDRDDARWLLTVLLPARIREGPPPPQGRFNAGQKLNSVLVSAATVGFVITGAVMWQGAHVSTSLSEACDSWHLLLTAVMVPLVAGHLALALLVPSTAPALRGIVTGRVRLDFAMRRHAKWAARITSYPPSEPSRDGTIPGGPAGSG